MFCKNCGSPVPEGAAICPFCGVAVTKESGSSRRIYVRPDYCCLCGQPLTAGHAVLFTYQSGDEARVDKNCCNMLGALYDKGDPEKMKRAVDAIRARIPDLDPAVADNLQPSLRQAEEFLAGKAPEQQRFTREVTGDSARREAALKESRKRRRRRGLKITLICVLGALLLTAAVLAFTGVIPMPASCAPGGQPAQSAEGGSGEASTEPAMVTYPPLVPTQAPSPEPASPSEEEIIW